MLQRIAAKELLVEFAADPRHHHIFGRADLVHGLCACGEPVFQFVGGEFEPVKAVYGIEVDRDRHQHPVDMGEHPVLVGPPLREL